MKKPIALLAVLPLLALLAAPAAEADPRGSSHHVKKKLLRLADDVSDGAREVFRTANGRHGRHRAWGYGRDHGFYGPRDDYTLRLLADLESRARDFEKALHHRPLTHTHREFEALVRTFNLAADTLYRARVSPALERDFECLAEYMFSLNAYYEEYAYPRRARYRGHDGRYDRRVEVYGPRWNVAWWERGRRGYDRDWDSDSDSDSDSY